MVLSYDDGTSLGGVAGAGTYPADAGDTPWQHLFIAFDNDVAFNGHAYADCQTMGATCQVMELMAMSHRPDPSYYPTGNGQCSGAGYRPEDATYFWFGPNAAGTGACGTTSPGTYSVPEGSIALHNPSGNTFADRTCLAGTLGCSAGNISGASPTIDIYLNPTTDPIWWAYASEGMYAPSYGATTAPTWIWSDSATPSIACSTDGTYTAFHELATDGAYLDARNQLYVGLKNRNGVALNVLTSSGFITAGAASYDVSPNATYQLAGGSTTAAPNVLAETLELADQNSGSVVPGQIFATDGWIPTLNTWSQVVYGAHAIMVPEMVEDPSCTDTTPMSESQCTKVAGGNLTNNPQLASWYADRMTFTAKRLLMHEHALDLVHERAAEGDPYVLDMWPEEQLEPNGSLSSAMAYVSGNGSDHGSGCPATNASGDMHGVIDLLVAGSCVCGSTTCVDTGSFPAGVYARFFADLRWAGTQDVGPAVAIVNPQTTQFQPGCSVTVNGQTYSLTGYRHYITVTGGPVYPSTTPTYTYPTPTTPTGLNFFAGTFECTTDAIPSMTGRVYVP